VFQRHHARDNERVVHDVVVSSAGVMAGIDMAFDEVDRLCGRIG
jgi:transcriptional regulator GlxA family with amidase domain